MGRSEVLSRPDTCATFAHSVLPSAAKPHFSPKPLEEEVAEIPACRFTFLAAGEPVWGVLARAGRPSFKGPFDYEVYWGLVTLPQPNPPQRAVVGAQGDVSHPELLAGLVGCKHNNNGRNVRREYPTALSWRQAQLERTVLPSAMVAP